MERMPESVVAEIAAFARKKNSKSLVSDGETKPHTKREEEGGGEVLKASKRQEKGKIQTTYHVRGYTPRVNDLGPR